MSIYIIISIVIGLFALIEIYSFLNKDDNHSIHSLMFALTTVLAIIFVGFRECGFDYDSYYDIFQDLNTPGWKENADIMLIEFGYAWINHILGNFRLVFVFMAFVTILLQFTFIYKYSPYPFLSLFLLLGAMFYPSLMGQYRQAFAIALVLWAFADRNNKVRFFFMLAIAVFFHASSLLALIVLFLPERILKTKIYIVLLVIGLVLNFTIKSYVVSFSTLLPELMSEKVDIYTTVEDFSIGLNITMLLRIFIFLTFIHYKDKITEHPNGSLFINIYFVSLMFYLALGALPQLGGRGSVYFYYLEFILVPMLISNLRGIARPVWLLLFLALSVWRQIDFFSEWADDYIPYYNALF